MCGPLIFWEADNIHERLLEWAILKIFFGFEKSLE